MMLSIIRKCALTCALVGLFLQFTEATQASSGPVIMLPYPWTFLAKEQLGGSCVRVAFPEQADKQAEPVWKDVQVTASTGETIEAWTFNLARMVIPNEDVWRLQRTKTGSATDTLFGRSKGVPDEDTVWSDWWIKDESSTKMYAYREIRGPDQFGPSVWSAHNSVETLITKMSERLRQDGIDQNFDLFFKGKKLGASWNGKVVVVDAEKVEIRQHDTTSGSIISLRYTSSVDRSSLPAPPAPAGDGRPKYQVGEPVSIKHSGKWCPGTVTTANNEHDEKVHVRFVEPGKNYNSFRATHDRVKRQSEPIRRRLASEPLDRLMDEINRANGI